MLLVPDAPKATQPPRVPPQPRGKPVLSHRRTIRVPPVTPP
ncbi:hypothetical protein MIZ01_1969 [Sideroxyarcus emersonii]|uniref:Uncharacterized protein n=1 Tax=Sideroxyarcus emersonii TaxID=2764705 RepID=A0AAN1XB94_9PROT|nr:hypothetical protein MIZ01_1969 [Sideroxyarcus emersonii]